MKSTITLRIGSRTLLLRGSSRRELSTVAASLISGQPTLPDLLRSISSLASAGGRSLRVLQGGRTIARYGRAHVHVSRSASPASRPARPTNATSGQNSTASLPVAVPLSSWENRLRQRLASLGSTECVLTWKQSATPQGRPLSRLVPSTRPIGGTDCGLWPTSTAADGRRGSGTVRPQDTGIPLPQRVALMIAANPSLWPTAAASDCKGSVQGEKLAERMDMARGVRLPEEVTRVVLFPSPTVACATGGQSNRSGDRRDEMLLGGLARSMSQVPTEKPGALNPEFVSWLMGFPPEWVNCAPSVTRSSRKSRPK